MSHEIFQPGILDVVGIAQHGSRIDLGWHSLGTPIREGLSAVEAGEEHGIFYPIERWRLQAVGPNGQILDVDTHRANVRTRDLQGESIEYLLGVVGADYQICHNRELAEFMDALSQTGKVEIETFGTIRGGKRVWFLARGEGFEVGGDTVYPYLLGSNGHDAGAKIRLTPTTIKAVCSNTLHMIIPSSAGGFDSAAWAIRHTGDISSKLAEARDALKYYEQTLRQNREVFDNMQAREFSRDQAKRLFAGTYAAYWEVATEEELQSADDKVRRTAECRLDRMKKATDAFLSRYDAEQTATSSGQTLWAAFNGVTGYLQHDRAPRGKDDQDRAVRRLESNLFGLNADRTHEVLAAALAS